MLMLDEKPDVVSLKQIPLYHVETVNSPSPISNQNKQTNN